MEKIRLWSTNAGHPVRLGDCTVKSQVNMEFLGGVPIPTEREGAAISPVRRCVGEPSDQDEAPFDKRRSLQVSLAALQEGAFAVLTLGCGSRLMRKDSFDQVRRQDAA